MSTGSISSSPLVPGQQLFFFPRVRTPCGHGAQVIVEGREKQSDGGENNKDHNHNPKTTTKGPQAESPPSCSLSSVLGETGETKRVSRRGPELTNEKHIGAGLCSSKVAKRLQKGPHFTNMSDQRPHPSAAKSWSRCRSTLQYGVSQCFNVDFIPSKWGGVAMQHAVEKTFLVAQPVQPVALTSQVACYQSTINKWRP